MARSHRLSENQPPQTLQVHPGGTQPAFLVEASNHLTTPIFRNRVVLLFRKLSVLIFLKSAIPETELLLTGPLGQNIEQAYRPHSGVEWLFPCSMRTKRRHRAGVSAPQPPGMPIPLLDELHERWRRGHSMRLLRHYPEDVLCTPVGIVYVSMWRRVRMCIRKVSTYWGGYLEFVKLQRSHFGSVFGPIVY